MEPFYLYHAGGIDVQKGFPCLLHPNGRGISDNSILESVFLRSDPLETLPEDRLNGEADISDGQIDRFDRVFALVKGDLGDPDGRTFFPPEMF